MTSSVFIGLRSHRKLRFADNTVMGDSEILDRFDHFCMLIFEKDRLHKTAAIR